MGISVEGISAQVKVDQYCQHRKKKSGQTFLKFHHVNSILLYNKYFALNKIFYLKFLHQKTSHKLLLPPFNFFTKKLYTYTKKNIKKNIIISINTRFHFTQNLKQVNT